MQPLPVTEPLAAVSLADAGLDTGRPAAPESTIGGETSCIICFERPKSHLARRGAVQPLVRVRPMLRANARVPVLPRASDDVARPAPCVISSRWNPFFW